MTRKYIFVSGGVISGLGKGISAASIAFLLKSAGYTVAPVKCENYLNVDAGVINPIEHGDPFLCEDGTEADMDIGTYEKFLNEDMGRTNFITLGQIYKEVIDRERRFEYEGEDVEAIPHITNEIIRRIDLAGKKNNAEIIVVELGGTAGEYQNVLYYEASRIIAVKHPGSVIHVHVSYVPTPPHLGEPKTKPTQLSVRVLNSLGIQPDIIIGRSEKPLDQRRKERLALFCNLHPQDVISAPDARSVYEVPLQYADQNLHKRIFTKLDLEDRSIEVTEWKKLISRIAEKKTTTIEIGIVGKYFGTGEYQLRDSYAALFDALDHASWAQNVDIKTHWINAEKVEKEGIEKFTHHIDGMIVPIGWGERGAEGMITAASWARENKIPFLGLCYGMQLAVIAFARDVIGWKNANTQENNPKTDHPVIHLMPMQEKFMQRRAYGGTMRLGGWEAMVKPDTLAWKAYDEYGGFIDKSKGLTSERHRHRYEFNDEYVKEFEQKGLVISAQSVIENLAEIVELPKDEHPFYLGTQGHPEYKSRPLHPHPIFLSFIKACMENKMKK